MELAGKKFVLGITGGIAAYKTAELVRILVQQGAQVQVLMSRAAHEFVTPATLQALSGQTVLSELWQTSSSGAMGHIYLTREVDAVVVAPVTAHFLAKIALGLADDLLSTTLLAMCKQHTALLLAPAMNREMWADAALQTQVQTLKQRGVHMVGPAAGEQACGELGLGRMAEPEQIYAHLCKLLTKPKLLGKHVLITAGPTLESIDPVRVITNRSSGKMGYALARAAYQMGARVSLVSGPTALIPPYGVDCVQVESAEQMFAAVQQLLPADVFIACAAVADWRVKQSAAHKIKKNTNVAFALTEWVENPDILAWVAREAKSTYCVGFAAESENLEAYAKQKRLQKAIPLIAANIGPESFAQDCSSLLLIDAERTMTLSKAPKFELALALCDQIAQRLSL